jgi:CheY-like chemotaxis protein
MTLPLEGIRILVVEDDPDSLELLGFFLSGEGAVVTTARSGREARDALSVVAPDVLISDLSLPDEDGLALMASVRAEPRTSHVPAIAVTGHSDDAALSHVIKAGFNTRIVKPIELSDVARTVLELVRGTDQALRRKD